MEGNKTPVFPAHDTQWHHSWPTLDNLDPQFCLLEQMVKNLPVMRPTSWVVLSYGLLGLV